MLFLATVNKLNEISFNRDNPTFNIEKLAGEYLKVKDKFSNPNIYFIGTSRGCSCDFGIEQNTIDTEEQKREIQTYETGIVAGIRKAFGKQKKYMENKVSYENWRTEEAKKYLEETNQLIDIIQNETTQNNNTEMFYCWAGEYGEEIEETKVINLNLIDLHEAFDEFYEKDKIIFTKGSH